MKAKILLVDDNEAFLDSTKDVLEEEGYDVSIAVSGKDAIKIVEDEDFDVAIMDIKMPGMNGVEAFIKMKKLRPNLRAVMVTAYSLDTLIQQSLKEGAYGVFKKPVDLSQIIDEIERIKECDQGCLVLVADDDEELCDNLENILSKEGYQVVSAYNGKDAVRQAKKYPFVVLLLDMMLPDNQDGLDLYKRIKEIRPNINTIIITGYPSEMAEGIREIVKDDLNICLTKPFDMKDLLEQLSCMTSD